MGLTLRVRPSLIITRMITDELESTKSSSGYFITKWQQQFAKFLRTLLLRKEKPTTSVTEWANASRQELNNIERTRSDRQEAQKQKAREIFGHIVRE